jgi:hypothetical protein
MICAGRSRVKPRYSKGDALIFEGAVSWGQFYWGLTGGDDEFGYNISPMKSARTQFPARSREELT